MMKARKIHENLDFERGKDPKRTLDIGLNPIEIVYAESYIGNRSVPFSRSSRSIKSALKNWSNNEDLYNWQFWDKDHHTYLSSDLEGKTVRYLGKIYKLGNIYESINFERGGKDLKSSMGIGLAQSIKKGLQGLKKEDAVNGIYMWDREHITIDYFLYPHYFDESLQKHLDLKYFEDIRWEKYKQTGRGSRSLVFFINGHSYGQSLRKKYTLTIKPQYLEYFQMAFDGSYLKESANFERGLDPKRSIGIGLKIIDIDFMKIAGKIITSGLFIKDYLDNYLASAVKLTYQNPTMAPWIDFVTSEDGEEEQFSLYDLWFDNYDGVYYDGKYYPFPKEYKKLKESANFERGKTPKEALSIGVEAQYQKIIDRVSEENTKNNYFKPVHKGVFKGVPYIIFQDTIVGSNELWGKDPFIGTFIRNDTIEDARWTSTIGKAIKSIKTKISEE